MSFDLLPNEITLQILLSIGIEGLYKHVPLVCKTWQKLSEIAIRSLQDTKILNFPNRLLVRTKILDFDLNKPNLLMSFNYSCFYGSFKNYGTITSQSTLKGPQGSVIRELRNNFFKDAGEILDVKHIGKSYLVALFKKDNNHFLYLYNREKQINKKFEWDAKLSIENLCPKALIEEGVLQFTKSTESQSQNNRFSLTYSDTNIQVKENEKIFKEIVLKLVQEEKIIKCVMTIAADIFILTTQGRILTA